MEKAAASNAMNTVKAKIFFISVIFCLLLSQLFLQEMLRPANAVGMPVNLQAVLAAAELF